MNFKINHDTPANKIGYGVIPIDRRGIIKGNVTKVVRKGGDMTNAAYAAEHGITKRQASKQRRGY
jgi:hypothetical protein